jgi:hypothetical protein
VILGTGIWVGIEILLDPGANILKRLATKKVDRVEKLAVLKQVAVAVPEPRDHISRAGVDVGRLELGYLLVGQDMAERAVSHREAPSVGPVIVEGCDALVAVRVPCRRWCRGTGGLRADERLLESISDGERGYYGGSQ